MLWAVHISDSVLQPGWVAAGWAGAAALAGLGAWRMGEEDVPRVALLTAAFFVASSIHVPIGPVRGHLLLNGLLGVVLGRRAGLAILVGLVMQAALIGHGGNTTIGVTCCVMTLPALAAAGLFAGLQRLFWTDQPAGIDGEPEPAAIRAAATITPDMQAAPPGASVAPLPALRRPRPGLRSGLVAASVVLWVLSLAFSIAWLSANGFSASGEIDLAGPARSAFHPLTLAAALALALLAVRLEARLENPPEFPLGLLLGELTVLATVILNCLVLILGGEADWRLWAVAQLIAHLPVAVVEGIVLGFTVGFLARVKPEMLE